MTAKVPLRVLVVLFLVVFGALGSEVARAEGVNKLPLAISRFDDVPPSIANEISKRTFDNRLRSAASESVVFDVLAGTEFVKAAISEEASIASQLYGASKAEYFLLQCAISGSTTSMLKASAVLATFQGNRMIEIATITAEANNVDQLMARFWANLDRPLEAHRVAPDPSGMWKFLSGHAAEVENDISINPPGDSGVVTGDVWDWGRTREGGEKGDWRSGCLEMRWDPAGFFRGRYQDSKNKIHLITLRLSSGEGGRRNLTMRGDDLEIQAQEQEKLADSFRWAWEVERVQPVEPDRDRESDRQQLNSGELAGRFEQVLGFSEPNYNGNVSIEWQGKHRATILPGYNLSTDWKKLEVFIIKDEWHVYYFKEGGDFGRLELFHIEKFKPFLSPAINMQNSKTDESGRLWWGATILPARQVADAPGEMLKERLWYGNLDTREYPVGSNNIQF